MAYYFDTEDIVFSLSACAAIFFILKIRKAERRHGREVKKSSRPAAREKRN